MNAIYDGGVDRALDKIDIDIVGDWLDEEERREYQKLHFKMDSMCVLCGNPEKMYWCSNCDNNQEYKGKCRDCTYNVKLDKKYHNNC